MRVSHRFWYFHGLTFPFPLPLKRVVVLASSQLDSGIRAQMAIYDDSVGLESFMQKATRISQRLSACHTAKAAQPSVSPPPGSPVPEPMQVDSTRLSDQERARRLAAGLCLYCAAADHFIRSCPIRPPRPAVSTLQLDPVIATLSLMSVQLLTHLSTRAPRATSS